MFKKYRKCKKCLEYLENEDHIYFLDIRTKNKMCIVGYRYNVLAPVFTCKITHHMGVISLLEFSKYYKPIFSVSREC